VGALDFRMGGIGAPINGLKAFLTTEQLSLPDKAANAVALALSPVVKALVDFDGAMEDIRNLDGISFSDWFLGRGGSRGSITRMWDPIAYALVRPCVRPQGSWHGIAWPGSRLSRYRRKPLQGFIDCDNISARCMLTIFQLFAVRSEVGRGR
jgi:zeta-carotene desaturase